MDSRKINVSPRSYEKLVNALAQHIANNKEIKLVTTPSFGPNNKVEGASGFQHQIDVSVEYETRTGKRVLKLIECKLHVSKKLGLDEALCFYARICDIQNRVGKEILVEGNLFTSIGYSGPAKRFADHYGIATNTLQSDLEGWSISFADDVVVSLRSLELRSEAQKTGVGAQTRDSVR